MNIVLYAHIDKETARGTAELAGLTGEALNNAMYLGYEHKMEYEVDPQTGKGVLVAVDGKAL